MVTSSPLTLLLDAILFQNADQVTTALNQIRTLVNLEHLHESPLQSIRALEEIVQALMKHHPQLAKVPSSRDKSLPIHYAASIGNTNIARPLLRMHRQGLLMQNRNGKTPLHYAAREGKLDMVQQILQIAPETASKPNKKGKLPLHFATREGHLEICRILLQVHPEGASWQTHKGKVALHFCARWGHLELAQLLHATYPQGVSTLDYEGSVPLHDATREGQFPMTRFLVPLYPQALARENMRGETPLFPAVRSGNYDLCLFLVQAWPEGGRRVLQNAKMDDSVGCWEPGLLDLCLHGAVDRGGGDAYPNNQNENTTNNAASLQSTCRKRPADDVGEVLPPKRLHYLESNDPQSPPPPQVATPPPSPPTVFLSLHAALECGASAPVLSHILEKSTSQLLLMQRNRMGMLPLHLAAMHSSAENLPIIKDVIWKRYQQACSVRDHLGRLPLQLALR